MQAIDCQIEWIIREFIKMSKIKLIKNISITIKVIEITKITKQHIAP